MDIIKHPHSSNFFRGFIARQSWLTLILVYLTFSILYGFCIGFLSILDQTIEIVYKLIQWDFSVIPSLLGDIFLGLQESGIKGFLFFWSVEKLNLHINSSSHIFTLLTVTPYVIKIITHALFVGAVISKIMIPTDIFVAKQSINIFPKTNGEGWLATFRLYNSSSLEINDLNFSLYLRRPKLKNNFLNGDLNTIELEPVVSNYRIKIANNKNNWPISIPKVPYSIEFELQDGDVCVSKNNEWVLRSIQGQLLCPDNLNPVSNESFSGETFLVLLAQGKVPRLASQLMESHWLKLAENGNTRTNIQFGHFKDINVLPGNSAKAAFGNPKKWKGWADFEGADHVQPPKYNDSKQYVFGYGSLIDINALEQYLIDKGLDAKLAKKNASEAQLVKLKQFTRCWNVAMDNNLTIKDYKVYSDPIDNKQIDAYVTFMNIEPKQDTDEYVFGVIYEVNETILNVLDKRERNYFRTKLQANKFCTAKDEPYNNDGVIWTYIAMPDAIERYNEGIRTGKAIVNKEYLDSFESSLRNIDNEEFKYYLSTSTPEFSDIRETMIRDLKISKT